MLGVHDLALQQWLALTSSRQEPHR